MSRIVMPLSIAVMLGLSLAYLGLKTFSASDTIDFKYIWLAGDLWRVGQNPYTDAYAIAGQNYFVGYNRPGFWVYPPNWWPVATGMSLLEYRLAGDIWRLMSTGMLVFGCLTLSRTIGIGGAVPLWRHAVFWGYTGTMFATAVMLSLGQTSALVFLGVCLFSVACLRASRVVMIAALILLSLKPTTGVVFGAFLIPSLFWWPALIAAGVAALLMALPVFVQDGFAGSLSDMLGRLAQYGNAAVNSPPEMTGVRHLAERVLGLEFNSFACIAAGLICALLIGMCARARWSVAHQVELLALLVAVVAFFVPLHTYDLLFLAPLIVLTASAARTTQITVAVGMAAAWRANNLEALLKLTTSETVYFAGSFMVSASILLMMIVLVGTAMRQHRGMRANLQARTRRQR